MSSMVEPRSPLITLNSLAGVCRSDQWGLDLIINRHIYVYDSIALGLRNTLAVSRMDA